MVKKKKKKKKIYDRIYWQGYQKVILMERVVICRIEEEPVSNGNNYKIYYNVNDDGKVRESWIRIGAEGTGIKLGKFRRYMVDRSGKLDIIGIKKHLHNREMSEILDNL